MGLFNFIFGNKKDSESIEIFTREISYYTPEYFRILDTRPDIFKIWGRNQDFPKYDDSFKTDEKYSLRELLLLVWWGKTKSGRKSTITIPKYFFTSYNLNAEKLTGQFKKMGLICDINDRTVLTDMGKLIFDKYKALWEIHSIKQYPTNLDTDFPTWDKNKFELKLYQMELKYYQDLAYHCKRMIDYFNSLNVPANAKEIHDEVNYYINQGSSNLAKVNDYKEKIAILKDKINENREI